MEYYADNYDVHGLLDDIGGDSGGVFDVSDGDDDDNADDYDDDYADIS